MAEVLICALACGLSFAVGVFLGHRIVEWLEDAVWRFWQH